MYWTFIISIYWFSYFIRVRNIILNNIFVCFKFVESNQVWSNRSFPSDPTIQREWVHRGSDVRSLTEGRCYHSFIIHGEFSWITRSSHTISFPNHSIILHSFPNHSIIKHSNFFRIHLSLYCILILSSFYHCTRSNIVCLYFVIIVYSDFF